MSKPITGISEVANLGITNNDIKLPALNADYIQSCIYFVRGNQVLLDRDLAKLYQVETVQLNRQVKRNITRFPEDFMFQLTTEEFNALKCQNGISNRKGYSAQITTVSFLLTKTSIYLELISKRTSDNYSRFL